MDRPGEYAFKLHAAAVKGGWNVWLVALGWIVFPFILASLLHPGDVVNFHYVLQGVGAQKFLTARQMSLGFVETLFALAFLLLLQFFGILWFYRRTQVTPALWPCAAILPGVIGNAAWFVFTRHFDATGLVIGLAPMALTFATERLLERMGRDFVFGPRVSGLH